MSESHELQVAVPAAYAPGADGPSLRRVLVPVRSPDQSAEALALAARVCSSTGNCVLCLLHIRIYDPPARRCGGRFYPQTRAEAANVVDEALLTVWCSGARASTAVVDAPRGQEAAAIAQQASAWRADVIVLTRRRRPAISRMVLGSVSDQVMRKAACPVLMIPPKRK